MTIERLRETDQYEYGNSPFVGSSKQPRSFSVFVKSNEKGTIVFRECALVSKTYENHRYVVRGTVEGVKSIHQALVNEAGAPLGQVAYNFWRGMITTALPLVGKIVLNINDRLIEDFYHTDAILNAAEVASNNNIAGIYADGKLIGTVPVTAIDAYGESIQATDNGRLSVLTRLVKRTLLFSGDHTSLSDLQPITTPLSLVIEKMKAKANKYALESLEIAADGIEKIGETLDIDEAKRVQVVNMKVAIVISNWLQKGEEHLHKDLKGLPLDLLIRGIETRLEKVVEHQEKLDRDKLQRLLQISKSIDNVAINRLNKT